MTGITAGVDFRPVFGRSGLPNAPRISSGNLQIALALRI